MYRDGMYFPKPTELFEYEEDNLKEEVKKFEDYCEILIKNKCEFNAELKSLGYDSYKDVIKKIKELQNETADSFKKQREYVDTLKLKCNKDIKRIQMIVAILQWVKSEKNLT